jgi:hypothetical protein
MIFFGGSGSPLITALQRLATQKIFKSRQKHKNKSHFYSPEHRFSCQNGLKTAHFCCQYYNILSLELY